MRPRLLLSAVLLGASLLAGCSVFGSSDSEKAAAKTAERLRLPPDLNAGGNQATAVPTPARSAEENQAPRAELLKGDDGPRLILPDSFYEAWRRVGFAIDRLGFTLEDRNRAEGQYFVRYDPRADQEPRKKGFLEGLAFWRSESDQVALYVIQLKQDGRQTDVTVTDEAGKPAPATAAERILALLYEQLR